MLGRRLAVCTETEDGRRLAEATVKELTGSDMVTARRMREDYWSFTPTQKSLLVANHRPDVRGTDTAIWRRLPLVPLEVVISPVERDKTLPTRLAQALPGILAWCVRGCLAWQKAQGPDPPQPVVEATQLYQAEQDALAGFLDEGCRVDPTAQAGTSELLEAYRPWSGDKTMSLKRVGLMLNERGFGRRLVGGRTLRPA
jgi:putative DNA primase/helicase